MAASKVEFEGVQTAQRLWPLVVDDERLVRSVRRGEKLAFDVLYERHSHELFVFCRRLLGSSHDAEEALQGTFAKAHRALIADARPIEVRPWLYAIARNVCLSIIRARRPGGEVAGDTVHDADAVADGHDDTAVQAEQRQEVRELLGNVIELPQRQRDALVLAELHGMRHTDVGEAMGVRPEQVKAYVHQARANLLAEREARTTDCLTIRQELDAAGGSTRRARIRRHVRSCPGCRAHAQRLRRGRGAAAVFPLGLLASLRHKFLGLLISRHSAPASPAPDSATAVGSQFAELGGGGGLAMAAKVLAGLALLGAGAKVGTAVVEQGRPAPPAAAAGAAAAGGGAAGSTASALDRALGVGYGLRSSGTRGGGSSSSGLGHRGTPATPPGGGGASRSGAPSAGTSPAHPIRAGGEGQAAFGETPSGKAELPRGKSEVPRGKEEVPRGKGKAPRSPGKEAQGRSEENHGASEEAHGRSEEGHGRSEEAHGRSEEHHGASEEPHGRSAEAPGKSEEPHGKAAEAPGHSEEAHGRAAEAHGKPEEQGAKAAEPPGKSEAPGHSEQPRGRSEEPHGKS